MVKVKDYFQYSLIYVKHAHQIKIFKLLRHHVSEYALKHILTELQRSKSSYFNVSRCGCVLRKKMGFPCACELFKYSEDGVPIPRDAIDPHWKQLSMVPLVEKKIDLTNSSLESDERFMDAND
ncbi:hypothetical protein BVC80_1297g12 [Macleaya cordata]|uniref:Protein FAR1-RELATED SEQUENCE n=1 Tax=Macleaya cordata TaxID=56857 RepID=A0A200QCV6_MACCD|nr:hypothetical protein BVC80_1297g12 [Macleaya cordata]